MTATLTHPSLAPAGVRPFGDRRRACVRRVRDLAADLRPRRRVQRLGVVDAWRLLSDDPPSFGDDD